MIFFNLLALMDDDDNEGRAGSLCFICYGILQARKTRRWCNATVSPSGRVCVMALRTTMDLLDVNV